ncbi:MAG: hypothetical protein ABI878_05115 [Acidobacteriota bacterium]
MKLSVWPGIAALLFLTLAGYSQSYRPNPTPTPVKVVVTNTLPPPTRIVQAAPAPTPIVVGRPRIVGDEDDRTPDPNVTPQPARTPVQPTEFRTMSFGQMKSRIAEAKRLMQTRPIQTASEDPLLTNALVRIAFYDWKTQRVDFVVMNKDSFLDIKADTQTVSSAGQPITVHTIRANGVNTPITLTDGNGQAKLPLLVQYPVEKNGKFIETAYYMSTHPGLVNPEVVNAGRLYVQNIIEIARDRLKEKGVTIQPKVADIAERLATVEHVDHTRFRTEPAQNIFNDIFTLYALNEGQTFRYSVSTAGAGGMVQMIPSTYQMIRSRYPNIGLMPDFVEGMRNHVNASQAMLLYMQMTWNDMNASPTITNAVAGGLATQDQLMAAGYNSNPSKLAGYINRGGADWTGLIPRETKMYLQIYGSLQSYVPITARTR